MKRIFIVGLALLPVGVAQVKVEAKTTMQSRKTVSSEDRQWLKEAAEGEMKEITIGKMVSKHATQPSVRTFASRMVKDHTKATAQLKKLAASKGLTLPHDMGKKNLETYHHLAQLPGSRMGHDYMMNMVEDHMQDVATFRKEAVHGDDRDVKAWAKQTIPVLQQHLSLARSTAHQVRATHVSAKKPTA